MTEIQRNRLKDGCDLCRKIGSGGDQLLLVRLEDVEELLQAEAILRDILKLRKDIAEFGKEENDRSAKFETREGPAELP